MMRNVGVSNGTANVAKVMAAVAMLTTTDGPTAWSQEVTSEAQYICPDFSPTTLEPMLLSGAFTANSVVNIRPLVIAGDVRSTTETEEICGEIRSWRLFSANWDGEGSAIPDGASLKDAVEFVHALESTGLPMPDPMLLASGRAALYWKTENLYADLEFTGVNQVSYYIERNNEGKHKGVAVFSAGKVPNIFVALLGA